MTKAVKILAVDDNTVLLTALNELLLRQGYDVTVVSHGTEALQVATEHPFDVAIVDYEIPTTNGLEILKHLREVLPRCVRILMSGRLDLDTLIDAVNRGEVTRVLEKPFRGTQLVKVIEEALEARSQAESSLNEQEADARSHLDAFEECMNDDFIRLALQPIVSAKESKIFAYEALLRSSHPLLDNPLAVLQAAERLSKIDALANLVFQRAIDWFAHLKPDVKLFVNMHRDELADDVQLCSRLDALGQWADRVVLEITERTRIFEVEAWERSIARIVDRGFSLAVDDLGAGYNSLSVLAELQPQFLKVDMSIVRGVDHTPRKQRLIELLCRFADATDAQLIAEGVETEEEAHALRASGAHLFQGFLFGKPSLDPSGL